MSLPGSGMSDVLEYAFSKELFSMSFFIYDLLLEKPESIFQAD